MLSVLKVTPKMRSKCKICHSRIREGSLIKIEGIKNRYGYTQLNYHTTCILQKLEKVSDPIILDWKEHFTLKN